MYEFRSTDMLEEGQQICLIVALFCLVGVVECLLWMCGQGYCSTVIILKFCFLASCFEKRPNLACEL
jgi:hypothetical protein